jgi:drug/metabolite transporter (DMT)-like permease
MITFYVAISKEPISLVAAVPSTQPLFVFIYTLILSLFMPKILSEKISKKAIFIKVLSIIFLFVGTLLLVS